MPWHRQAIFKSKGDKLCSSAECRIWTRGPRHQIASRLNARWQTDWAIEDQAKNLNSTARPYDQRAFSPLGPTVSWLSHLALAIYIFVVVNFEIYAANLVANNRNAAYGVDSVISKFSWKFWYPPANLFIQIWAVDSLWPSDTIWRYRSGSTLA